MVQKFSLLSELGTVQKNSPKYAAIGNELSWVNLKPNWRSLALTSGDSASGSSSGVGRRLAEESGGGDDLNLTLVADAAAGGCANSTNSSGGISVLARLAESIEESFFSNVINCVVLFACVALLHYLLIIADASGKSTKLKLLNIPRFPRWELVVLIACHQGITESCFAVFGSSDDISAVDKTLAGLVLIVFSVGPVVCLALWCNHRLHHRHHHRQHAIWDKQAKVWECRNEQSEFLQVTCCTRAVPASPLARSSLSNAMHRSRFGPLFEELKGDLRVRSLFIVMVALPFQLLRSAFIGLFVSEQCGASTTPSWAVLIMFLFEAGLVASVRPLIDKWDNLAGIVENLTAALTVFVTMKPLSSGAESAMIAMFCLTFALVLKRPVEVLVRDHLPRFVVWVRERLCGGGAATVGPQRECSGVVPGSDISVT